MGIAAMMLEKLVQTIEAYNKNKFVYHFTDEKNFPLIKEHGLLSKNAMRAKGFWPVAPSGNDISWNADDKKEISDYVSLCMTRDHPMCFRAKEDGRISDPKYLAISPKVLLQDGVLFAQDIANKTGVSLLPLCEAELDIEVLYQYADWKNSGIKQRREVTKRYEILVPHGISCDMIKGICK